jgi:hypothetical protein
METIWGPITKERLLILDKDHLLSDAVLRGHERVLEWSLRQGAPVGWHLLEEAAASGRLDILQLLLQYVRHGKKRGSCRCFLLAVFAIVGGHLNVLKWLYYYQLPDVTYDTVSACPDRLDHLLSFRYCGSGELEWMACTLTLATYYGHLHILQWLRDLNPESFHESLGDWHYFTVLAAGYTEILHWLHSRRNPPGVYACGLMVDMNRLDYLQWAREVGGAWNDEEVVERARRWKRDDILRYFGEEGLD